ncbi:MAG: FKBP-type peptidyl-prolyl cis-trans isomerase [Nanoarchaeota archaeon]|mgnify:FL=1
MENSHAIKKGDFVELKFTGLVDGKVFDSNIPDDLKQINEKAEPEKTIVIVGQKMVVKGFDDFLEGKELNKHYEVTISPKDAFGSRRTDLVRIIPLKVFHEQKLNPRPGMTFVFDNQLAKVITISGARVITDFNNPLSGKDVTYKFNVSRVVKDLKERAETVCKLVFRYVPEISVANENVTIKGPKILESFIKQAQSQFNEFLGKEVLFEEVETKKPSDSE